MNWRNPFLTGYLAVTVIGAGILGYLLYSSYAHFSEVSDTYDTQVARLQSLQNRTPYPSVENNQAYAALTTQYRAEYDKLLAQALKMQKPIESITPQAFQDRLRAYVSEVSAAAKLNGVTLNDAFYLGFDQYRDTLPSNESAGALARELDAIRLVVDKLIEFKIREIIGIKRDSLPEEGGAPRPEQPAAAGNRRSTVAEGPKIVTANSFEIAFVADQSRLRQSLDAIISANKFFIIRNLTIENSKLEGPKKNEEASVESGAALPQPPAAQGTPQTSMRLLVGRETLTLAARIEMITFNPPDSKK
ncbi:MAG: Amuc_1100 family pilus-like protein [Terrimicrobiaceae bacterium]|nr:Amuc_1100 family pilus-like protein [Terrimicrobiaceae bacterium]